GDSKTHIAVLTEGIHNKRSSSGYGLAGDDKHVQQQFYFILRQQHAWQIPYELGPVILNEWARHRLRIRQVDLRTCRSGRTERKAAKLQAGRGGPGALFDQLKSKILCFLIALLLLQHLQAVHNGSSRTDQVVAYTRAQESSEIERVESNRCG